LERARHHAGEAVRAAAGTPWEFAARLELASLSEISPGGLRFGAGAPLDDAERLYRELAAMYPAQPEPHRALQAIFEHAGRAAEARQQAEEAARLENPPS